MTKIRVAWYIIKMIFKYNFGKITVEEKKALGLMLVNIKYNLIAKLEEKEK